MRHTSKREHGQAMVEFALAFTIFIVIVMAVLDLAKGVYMYDSVSHAAREIARTASVHPGATLGTSPEVASTVSAQQAIIPNLGTPAFTCVDISGASVSGTCGPGSWVRVTIAAPYRSVTPLIGLVGTFQIQSASSIQIP